MAFLAVVSHRLVKDRGDLRRSEGLVPATRSLPTAPSLPTALRDAWQFAAVCHLAKADAADSELAIDRMRATAPGAPGVAAHRELGLRCRLDLQCILRHQFSLKGKPSRRRNARPSSSVFAVVTTVMSMPRKRSILSWSISRNLNWAIDTFDRVTCGFCPVIVVRSRTAPSINFESRAASPTPMLTTTLVRPGICMTLS